MWPNPPPTHTHSVAIAQLVNLVYMELCDDCDFSLTNGGALRDGVAMGNITYLNLKSLYPFENSEIQMLIEGRYIRELIETTHVTNAVDYADCDEADPLICATNGVCDSTSCELHGHYPQWSGLRWAYNPREDSVLSIEAFDRESGYWR